MHLQVSINILKVIPSIPSSCTLQENGCTSLIICPNSPEVEGACRHVQFMTKILSCEKNSCRIFSKTRNGITNVKLNGLSYLVCQHCRRLSLSLSL